MNEVSQMKSGNEPSFHFTDNRPEVVVQQKMQEMANVRLQTMQATQLKPITYNSTSKSTIQKQGSEDEEEYDPNDIENYWPVEGEVDDPANNNAPDAELSDSGESDSTDNDVEQTGIEQFEPMEDDSDPIVYDENEYAINNAPDSEQSDSGESNTQKVNSPKQHVWRSNEHSITPNPNEVRPKIGKRGKAVNQNHWYSATLAAGQMAVADAKKTTMIKGNEKRQETSKIKEAAAIGIGKILSPDQKKRNIKKVNKRVNKKIADTAESRLEEIGIVLPKEKIRETISNTSAPAPALKARKEGFFKKKSNEKKTLKMKEEMATKDKEREADKIRMQLDVEEKTKNSKKKDTSDKELEEDKDE